MYKKIMVGYDGTKFSDCALKEAIGLAKESGAKLLLVSAPEINLELQAMAPEANEMMEKKARTDLDLAAAKVKKAGVPCETKIILTSSAQAALVETAKKSKVDLIVLGTHGRTGLVRLLMGSTTARVIGHAHCNVLVVRCP
ncbi:universal stress protein [Thiovibrio frasassiensis]|jgi:nucleotide-binding universal stress UspA family protein|uniref:Universal stress protein n=1 Tax=Thiovibrio frasassiensis TaxID=2984131 RepID=A0A9X4RLL2_9BACT|nr:universal stress protein [Thiovibrio frasassiensis]MDG4475268.1 universal stress protein [Thiovibrio frasassiensis]